MLADKRRLRRTRILSVVSILELLGSQSFNTLYYDVYRESAFGLHLIK